MARAPTTVDLENFNEWLDKRFSPEKRGWVKNLIINYLNTLSEHELVKHLNKDTYNEIYENALRNLYLK